MPRTARPDGLNELLDQQFAVASREQLLSLGLKDNAVQYRVRANGPWQTLLPGVYLGVSGGTNLIQKEMAALLYAGPGSVITGPAALLHHSIRGAADLAEVAEGIRSTAEGDLHDLTAAAALPTPLFNPSLYEGDTFIAKPDEWWPDAGVAVEADSREWHLRPAGWEYTMERHGRMAAAGIIVLHFSPRQLRREPAKAAQTIRLALERGRTRPALPIRTVPCPQ